MDRDQFSAQVTEKLLSHPLITIRREHIDIPPNEWDSVIIATGPLTSPELSRFIQSVGGEEQLAFFDAIAPIVHKESINFNIAWMQSRYDKAGPAGTGSDYINCPMNKEEYLLFIKELLASEKTELS